MKINYSLANDILVETYNHLDRISCITDHDETHCKEVYDIIEKSIINLNVILNEADIIDEAYCKIENILAFLIDKKNQFELLFDLN